MYYTCSFISISDEFEIQHTFNYVVYSGNSLEMLLNALEDFVINRIPSIEKSHGRPWRFYVSVCDETKELFKINNWYEVSPLNQNMYYDEDETIPLKYYKTYILNYLKFIKTGNTNYIESYFYPSEIINSFDFLVDDDYVIDNMLREEDSEEETDINYHINKAREIQEILYKENSEKMKLLKNSSIKSVRDSIKNRDIESKISEFLYGNKRSQKKSRKRSIW